MKKELHALTNAEHEKKNMEDTEQILMDEKCAIKDPVPCTDKENELSELEALEREDKFEEIDKNLEEKKRRRSIHRLKDRSQTSVRDLAKGFNEIADASELQLKDHQEQAKVRKKPPLVKTSSIGATCKMDGDNYQYGEMTPDKKAWILAASKSDENAIRRLVSDVPGIVTTRDTVTGKN